MHILNKMILDSEIESIKYQLERLEMRLHRDERGDFINLINAVNRQVELLELIKEDKA